MSAAPGYELWLPGAITPTLNVSLRQHWHQRGKKTREMAWAIRVALGRQRAPATPYRRARVVIERRAGGIPDADGLIGGCKGLIDCLMPFVEKKREYGLGFILDDGPAHLVLEVRALRVKKAERGMHITITPLE